MHICTIVPNYPPFSGGAELGMHHVLSTLARTTSNRYSVIVPTTRADLPLSEIMDGVEVHRYRRPDRWVKWLAPTYFGFRNNAHLLDKLKPDLVHVFYMLPTGLSAWVYAKRHRLPLLVSLVGHDIYDPFHQPPAPLRKIIAASLKRTHHIVANSTHIRQILMDSYGTPPEHISVVPFGVDVQRFRDDLDADHIRTRHGFAEGEVFLFNLQRLEARKGVDVLIRAMRKVVDHRPELRLLIAGKGRNMESLQTLIESLGLASNVSLIGFVDEDEKPLYYAAADVYIMHSHFEGLGIVLEEASACGTAVISTRAGGTVDVVIDGETGLLVPPNDPDSLADAILRLAENPALREQMGAAGRQHILQSLSLEQVASTYQKHFDSASRTHVL